MSLLGIDQSPTFPLVFFYSPINGGGGGPLCPLSYASVSVCLYLRIFMKNEQNV